MGIFIISFSLRAGYAQRIAIFAPFAQRGSKIAGLAAEDWKFKKIRGTTPCLRSIKSSVSYCVIVYKARSIGNLPL